jgi:hypothetical protein
MVIWDPAFGHVFLLVVPWLIWETHRLCPCRVSSRLLRFSPSIWSSDRNDCGRCQRTMHATLRLRDSDRRMYGSPFIWPCTIAFASPSTDDSQLFHGLTYLAQQVITWSDVLSSISAGPRVGVDNKFICK